VPLLPPLPPLPPLLLLLLCKETNLVQGNC
jgi:hypothetical protein